jgi:hypothetical protein
MMFFAWCRSLLARHRMVYWLAVAAVSLVLALTAAGQQRRLEAARRAWADSTTVWVTTTAHAPGDPLAVQRQVLPRAAIPDDALIDDPGSAVALRALHRNEIVTVDDLGASTAALADAGSRIVAIAADASTIGVVVGDQVDVVAAGVVLAIDGVVTSTSALQVSVAVAEHVAAAVASAAHETTAVLVLRPRGADRFSGGELCETGG